MESCAIIHVYVDEVTSQLQNCQSSCLQFFYINVIMHWLLHTHMNL